MKIQSLRVEQLRQFRQPFLLDELADGLNLIHGPNESGKSTLVRGIRAAFFERSNTKSVTDLAPWGDSSAAPTIELEFELDGHPCHLIKSFLHKKRCDLRIGSETYDGKAAEDRLAELLGYQFPGAGASKHEHWGIPGLLWVEQGSGQSITEYVAHAEAHLQSALESMLGKVASSGGDEVIARVEAARGQLLTGKGRPKGDYAELAKTCDMLEQQIQLLDTDIDRYRAQVDRLGELRREHEGAETEQPWERLKEELGAEEAKLAQIAQWKSQQEKEQQQSLSREKTLEALRGQQSQEEEKENKLKQREAILDNASQEARRLTDSEPSIQGQVDKARLNYEESEKSLRLARQQQAQEILSRKLLDLKDQIRGLDKTIGLACGYEEALKSARKAARENAIDLDLLAELRATSARLGEARIRSQAVATQIAYELDEDKSVELGEERLLGQGERLLLEASELRMPGIGTLRITPGGEDLASLRRRLARLDEEQASQLQALGVTSLEEAETKAQSLEQAHRGQEKASAQLEAAAPLGLDYLKAQLAEKQADEGRANADLDALPDTGGATVPLAQAEPAFALAEQALSAAEGVQREHQQARALAAERLAQAQKECDELRNEVEAKARLERIKQLEQEIASTAADLSRLGDSMRDRQQAIDNEHPDLLVQKVERLSISLRQLHAQHQQRAIDLASLQASLEAAGTKGLEEQRQELAARLEESRRRYNELHRRAQALDLLLGLLQAKRQELTRRLQAPLQKHLDHYLRILFPDACLEVDELLVPHRFSRGAEHGTLEEMSFGAREQMGLISRLAYADLLKEAGRPTLLILDDTLVHSDKQRLEPMKSILFDAARRHQILLFTCHPENWRDLGAAPRDLLAMKTAG
jgi:energy-coupling factor transporter ATP-binding protein EcfA2